MAYSFISVVQNRLNDEFSLIYRERHTNKDYIAKLSAEKRGATEPNTTLSVINPLPIKLHYMNADTECSVIHNDDKQIITSYLVENKVQRYYFKQVVDLQNRQHVMTPGLPKLSVLARDTIIKQNIQVAPHDLKRLGFEPPESIPVAPYQLTIDSSQIARLELAKDERCQTNWLIFYIPTTGELNVVAINDKGSNGTNPPINLPGLHKIFVLQNSNNTITLAAFAINCKMPIVFEIKPFENPQLAYMLGNPQAGAGKILSAAPSVVKDNIVTSCCMRAFNAANNIYTQIYFTTNDDKLYCLAYSSRDTLQTRQSLFNLFIPPSVNQLQISRNH